MRTVMVVALLWVWGGVMAGTAHAAERQVLLFTGNGPTNTPAEILGEKALQVVSADSREAALDTLREQARRLGADAVLEVTVERMKVDVPLAMVTGVPMMVLGGLESLFTLNAEPLRKATESRAQAVARRRVWVVRGMAVRLLR
jgi:hypothetical protein